MPRSITHSQLVRQFIPKAHRAVREMRRVTPPGGTRRATWDRRKGFVYFRMIFDTAAIILDRKANERRARAYSRPMTRPGDLASAWRDAGVQDVVEDIDIVKTRGHQCC